MAISTYKVFLMHKASSEGTYTKLIDIKEFPDLGGEPGNAGNDHSERQYADLYCRYSVYGWPVFLRKL